MSQTKSARIQDHFAELTDPRRREVTYPLINVVVIALCAVICGFFTDFNGCFQHGLSFSFPQKNRMRVR
jgi:hypothetical protein